METTTDLESRAQVVVITSWRTTVRLNGMFMAWATINMLSHPKIHPSIVQIANGREDRRYD
jgi:hypothetical protein